MATGDAFKDAEITSAADVKWSDGSLFNGHLLLMLAPATGRTKAFLRDSQELRIPLDIWIPIRDGDIQDKQKVWQSDEIEPSNSRYSDFWYDDTGTQVAASATVFEINADPFTITVPTLTALVAPSTPPTPDTVV